MGECSLKKQESINAVFKKGISFKGKLVNVYILESRSRKGANRSAFIVRKSLYDKKIVLRNRFRRILKEAYRKTSRFLLPGVDVVVLACRVKKKTKSIDIEKDLVYAFERFNKKQPQILS